MPKDQVKEEYDGDTSASAGKAAGGASSSGADNSDDEDVLFFESIRGNMGGVLPELKKRSYLRLMSSYDDIQTKLVDREELRQKALLEFPDDPEFAEQLAEAMQEFDAVEK